MGAADSLVTVLSSAILLNWREAKVNISSPVPIRVAMRAAQRFLMHSCFWVVVAVLPVSIIAKT